MSRRGFASMKPEQQKEIARKGGRAAHAKGNAHEFTSDEARLAGEKGGKAVALKLGSKHFSRIGRIGGKRSARNRQLDPQPEVKSILQKDPQGVAIDNKCCGEGVI